MTNTYNQTEKSRLVRRTTTSNYRRHTSCWKDDELEQAAASDKTAEKPAVDVRTEDAQAAMT